jgi:hypothetical protein
MGETEICRYWILIDIGFEEVEVLDLKSHVPNLKSHNSCLPIR